MVAKYRIILVREEEEPTEIFVSGATRSLSFNPEAQSFDVYLTVE